MAKKKLEDQTPEHHGEAYRITQVMAMYLVEESDQNIEWFAKRYHRTRDAIDLVYSWITKGEILPEKAQGRLWDQVQQLRELLGPKLLGYFKTPAELKAVISILKNSKLLMALRGVIPELG